MNEPVKITVSDPETGIVLAEKILENDYCLLVAGRCYLDKVTRHANGTHQLVIRGAP